MSTEFAGPIKLSQEQRDRIFNVRPRDCATCKGISKIRVGENLQFIGEEEVVAIYCEKCGEINFHTLDSLGLRFYKGLVIDQ